MVKCSRCGIEIDDSFDNCPNCGNDLSNIGEDELGLTENIACSQCGFEISDDSDFCPNCGKKLGTVQFMKCDECGSQIGENDFICPVCGSKITRPILCSNCGASLTGDAEFCEECGHNIHSSRKDLSPIEENVGIIARESLSILDRIILFFKQLFGGNS